MSRYFLEGVELLVSDPPDLVDRAEGALAYLGQRYEIAETNCLGRHLSFFQFLNIIR